MFSHLLYIIHPHVRQPVDMWSIGVIIYTLLGGYPPFHDENQTRLFRRVKAGSFKFHDEYWSNTSDQAKVWRCVCVCVCFHKLFTWPALLRMTFITHDQTVFVTPFSSFFLLVVYFVRVMFCECRCPGCEVCFCNKYPPHPKKKNEKKNRTLSANCCWWTRGEGWRRGMRCTTRGYWVRDKAWRAII